MLLLPETTEKRGIHQGTRKTTKGHQGVEVGRDGNAAFCKIRESFGICYRGGSCPPGARASRPHPLPSDASAAAFGLAPERRCCRRLRGSTLMRACSMGLRCRSQGDVAFFAERGGPKEPPASPARRSAAAASPLDSNSGCRDVQDFFRKRPACNPGHRQARTGPSPKPASSAGTSRSVYPVHPVHRCS